jgi:single-strand DNA-binding protein
MATSINKVLLLGNLTRDVELKYTQGNQAVANFGLAMNRKFKTAAGELREEVTFVDCEAWAATAENMSKFFSKGRPVLVEGRLKLDQWEDKDGGGKRSKIKVVIENFHFVDSKPGGGGSGGSGGGAEFEGSSSPAPQRAPVGAGRPAGKPAAAAPEDNIQEDDIPF